MAESGSIYSAIYSGVPVFEMLINGVAVMRRRTDSYMNATQILKVANIEKGKRTKILEKEVLTGEHEKVQGGYGKYQGTWIPCDRSKELAERYGVRDLLAPIFNFQLDSMGVQNGDEAFLTKEQAIVANKKKLSDLTKDRKQYPHYPLGDDSLSARKKHNTNEESMALSNSGMSSQPYQSPSFPPLPNQSTSSSSSTAINTEDNINSTERHRSVLMSIFLSDKPDQIPELLKNNHSSINLDMVIDEQGNTALHWATALARSKTVEFLVGHGANIACINYSGETPLMRGVMVTNNYDNQSFVTVFGLLKESLTLLDNKKRSVLHHCALTAGIQGRTNAAIHYMQVLMKEEETRGLLDTQDSLGDTALTIAIRLDCQALVDILKEAGAKEDTQNHIGLQVADYQQSEDSPMDEASVSQRTCVYVKRPYAPSQRGKEIIATVQKIVDALDNEYGSQLTTKENELLALQADLDTVTHQLERTRRSLEQRQSQSQKLSEAQQRTHNIEQALQNGWDQLQSLMQRANKPLPHPQDIDQFDTDQDIDALFDAPPLHYTQDATEEEKKHELENYIKNVQAKVKAYRANDEVLVCEIERLQKKFTDKELQCKRLIAACCNLPMDKIDDLVEPLTLAIESDPPDLDLARVIGFMDKIRRQGAFAVAASSTENSSTVTAAMPASHHQYQYANTSSLRSPQPESTANNNDTVETSSIQ